MAVSVRTAIVELLELGTVNFDEVGMQTIGDYLDRIRKLSDEVLQDYVDRKCPGFSGKRLKILMLDCLGTINARKAHSIRHTDVYNDLYY